MRPRILLTILLTVLFVILSGCGTTPNCPTCGTTINGAYAVINVIPVPEHNATGEPGGPFNSFDISTIAPNPAVSGHYLDYISDRIGLVMQVIDTSPVSYTHLQRSRRSLRVNITHNLGPLAANKTRRLIIGKDLAPPFFKANDFRTLPLRHVGKAIGEISICKYGDLGSRLHEVGYRGFHACATRTGDHQCGAVLGSENWFQLLLHVFHHLNEVRIKVSDNRLRQRLINPRVNHGRPGSEQIASRRLQGGQVNC